MTVVKSANGYIGGGYTDKGWSKKNTNEASNKSFLFSLHGLDNTPRTFPVKNPIHAIYCSEDSGPHFGGEVDAESDLCICDQCDIVAGSTSRMPFAYSGANVAPNVLFGAQHFLVADYEVYHLV